MGLGSCGSDLSRVVYGGIIQAGRGGTQRKAVLRGNMGKSRRVKNNEERRSQGKSRGRGLKEC